VPAKLVLPDNTEDLLAALKNMRDSGVQARNASKVPWLVAFEYLRGNRNFDELNYRDGTIRYSKPDSTTLDFRHEEVVSTLTREIGRLLSMDTMPKVAARKVSLDHLRMASVAQIALDSSTSKEAADRVKLAFISNVVTYGCAALLTWMEPAANIDTLMSKDGGLPPPEQEVVPPWEILSVPADPTDVSSVVAIQRVRWVPLEWLHSLGFKKKLSKDAESKTFFPRVRTVGQPPADGIKESQFVLGGSLDNLHGSVTPRTEEFVELLETWTQGYGNTLHRYVASVDETLLIDSNFEKDPNGPPPMSIYIARYLPVGGFYSRGLPDLLIPNNCRIEEAVDNLYRNVEDMDIFGTTYIPGTLGLPPGGEGSDTPRVQMYEPDPAAPNAAPLVVHPMNLGTLPAQVIQMGTALADRVSPPNPAADKGRIDSARGLGYLNELSNVPLTFASMSIASAYSGAYRCLLDKLRRVWPMRKLSITSFLDDALAGIVIDPRTGELSRDNVIPKPGEVEIGIVSPSPVSIEQQRRDLYDMLQSQIISARWFRILSRKLGLNLPVANDVEWESYRRAMLNNIVLFNDGEKPGDPNAVPVTPVDLYDVHLSVIDAFIARPEFTLAGVDVRTAFYSRRELILSRMGAGQQLPYPEDGAEQEQEVEKMMQQQGAGAGGPPGGASMPSG